MDARPVLVDRGRDQALARDGWVHVPFLDADDRRELLEAYTAAVPTGEDGLQLDYVRRDRRVVRRLTEALYDVLDPKFDAVFVDHRPVLASFIYKHPGPGSSFYLHRDITVNDPRANRCHTLWVPLVDVGATIPNGGLAIVPGSHRLATGEQGLDATVLVEPFQDALRDRLEPVELRAGDALVYDAHLLHGSGPNLSTQPRPAIGCAVARRSEPLVHTVATGRRHRVLYEVDRDYFVDHHPADVVAHGMPAGYDVVDEFDDTTSVSAASIQDALGLAEPPRAVVSIPSDLDDGSDGPPLPSGRVPFRPPRRDVALEPGDLAPLGDELAGTLVIEQHGQCRALTLRSHGHEVDRTPPALPRLPRRWRTLSTRDLGLVALGPEARLVLRIPHQRGAHHRLDVIECPQVRSGVLAGGRRAQFELGRSVEIPGGVEATLWNQGPGPLLVLVRRSLGPDRARRVTRR